MHPKSEKHQTVTKIISEGDHDTSPCQILDHSFDALSLEHRKPQLH